MKLVFSVLTLAIFIPGVLLADDYPKRKAGLWAIETHGQVTKQCTDDATDAKMMKKAAEMAGGMGATCTKNTMSKQGNDFVAESECKMLKTKTISKTVISGDFNSLYTIKTTATFDPPMMGMANSQTTMTAKWVGPCEAGQVPGDIIMANGMKMNMDQMGAGVPMLSK